MRLLHTSDWHLGQHFMGKTRQAEHQAFLTWLIEQIKIYAVDALLIAGDIFDTGAPPSYARELLNNFIVELRSTGTTLVILGGNHDSVAMLSESRTLLAVLNTHVIPAVMEDADTQLLTLKQKNGLPGALLCAIPFIRPRDVIQSKAGQSAEEKQQSLQQAIQEHYQKIFALAEIQRQPRGPLPIIATGHLTTVGASVSDSVREIYVGSLEAFPSNAFPPADYIALGHIHRPQKVGGLEHIRYCGSPIPLSFDEAKQQKEVLMVDFSEDTLSAVTPLFVPCFQPLTSLRGTLEQLPALIQDASQKGSEQQRVWLEITVCADGYLSDLQTTLHKMIEGFSVEVLRIKRERNTPQAMLQRKAQETLTELTPAEVFAHRLAAETIEPALQEHLKMLYQQIVHDISEKSAEGSA